MSLPANFVSSLTCPSTSDLLEIVKEKKKHEHSTFLNIQNEVRPIDLFCYLAARFGPPNGFQNLLRSQDSDNLVHWDWTLCTSEITLFLWGTNFRTDVIVHSAQSFGEEEKLELVNQIKDDLKNYGPKMADVRGSLEHWTEFVNPYWRLSKAIRSLTEELDELDLTSEFESGFSTPSTAVARRESWEKTASSYSRAFGLCFGIRSMLPVWAEAFINLLIYVQARPDIKTDTRLLENAFRQQIDIRIKSLHITCLGFERPVDYTTTVCKKFHSLINERNDLLHGNVSPDKQKFNDVYFKGSVPVFKEYRSLWDRTIAVDRDAVGILRLKDEVATVQDFIEYLQSCLEPKAREVIQLIARKRDLAKRKDGRLGILFPDHLAETRPSFKGGDEQCNA